MLPSPLALLSPGLGFLDRTLSSFRASGATVSTPSRLVACISILSGLTSYISGCGSGLADGVSAGGTLWRFAFGCCWEDGSEVRCRRRLLRVPLAGPPSCSAEENIFAVVLMESLR